MKPIDSASLPIDDFKQHILSTIKHNPLTILTAETGAGKSTRIPSWLWQQGHRVFITQPRRIAARSLSYYLSDQYQVKWGEEIGYQTGFEKKISKKTSLLYLTDGVQMLNEIRGLRHYDVLILDEIHEWNINQEILIAIAKKNLKQGLLEKEGKRVVIMSATVQSEKLAHFFNNAPVIDIQGRGYPVAMQHNHPQLLLADVMQMVDSGLNTLVFQPGKKEIEDFMAYLKENLEYDKLKAVILPLHSELSIVDQQKVFKHYTVPKVIVATDIAQTSLTIDDIDTVIDSGIKKEIRTIRGIEGLYPVDISRAECLQRAGRAGRVRPGHYILCAEKSMNDRQDFPEPEITRLNLESVLLRLIKWGINPEDLPLYHAPKKYLIKKAVEKLMVFGAIDYAGKITNDGEKMAELPVSIRGARMIVEAMKNPVLLMDSTLKLIAVLECKGIVNKDYQGEKYYQSPYMSDLLNQLLVWNSEKQNRQIINFKKLFMAKEIYAELKKRVSVPQSTIQIDFSKQLAELYRVILSALIDFILVKHNNIYLRLDEERQLDRHSVLADSKPDMVAGIPFDLVLHLENRYSGEKEKKILPLITFASAVSLKILEQLQPFSYKKEKEYLLENNHLSIKHRVYFGGMVLSEYRTSPDWGDVNDCRQVLLLAGRWYAQNEEKYPLFKLKENLACLFAEITLFIKKEESDFQDLWLQFINRQLLDYLRIDDLDFFFRFHPGFNQITFRQLLPENLLRKVHKAKWPERIALNQKQFEIVYHKEKPFLELTAREFEEITKEQLLLPSGQQAGIILDGRLIDDWDVMVYRFNRLKKIEVFNAKYNQPKPVFQAADLLDISFPLAFLAGVGKNNEKFEFYSAPHFIDDHVYLMHFMEKESAEKYFNSIAVRWKNFIRDFKKNKLDSMFRDKGWIVK
jgi:hypothetical protein